ncbi:MAG: hypothetical protein NC343_00095 [Muribaculum sp.]|nr:hypothetical protein [Muribaculaceae bacterium]MCM1080136.1 hypothetical protein [Muribaculum sp.]
MPTPQQQAVAQVYEFLLGGDAQMAASLAEEILADCGAGFNEAPGATTASATVMAATAYAEALLKSGRVKSAIAVLINALQATSGYNPEAGDMMTALITLWHAVELLLSQTSPDSPAQCDATETLCTAMACLLYDLYYQVGHTQPQHPALSDAYATLKLLSNLVQITPVAASLPFLISQMAAAAGVLRLI